MTPGVMCPGRRGIADNPSVRGTCIALSMCIMMRSVIPRSEWSSKLNEFSIVHDGWRVSLDVFNPVIGAQPEITNLPLRGVVAETGPQDSIIIIAAGWNDSEQIAHTVAKPTKVQLEQDDEGADVALEIESLDHTKTVLRIMAPALPEAVDGIPRPH